jgi:hypothetical protein
MKRCRKLYLPGLSRTDGTEVQLPILAHAGNTCISISIIFIYHTCVRLGFYVTHWTAEAWIH